VIQFFFLFVLFTSCEDLIEYSPYQNIVKDKWKEQNISNYQLLLPAENTEFSPFKIVLISDTHNFYDPFITQVNYINTLKDIDFVIHLGDFTTGSLNKEFNWYSTIINRLDIPFFTVIGNHDCLANGCSIYKNMFGPSDYIFTYKNVKFILFDDVIWEKNCQDPDFEWLDDALKNDDNYTHIIPFSHIPPWDGQFSYGNEIVFNTLMERNKINLSVHGHKHRFDVLKPYGDVNYLTIPSSDKHQLVILTINSDTILIKNVKY